MLSKIGVSTQLLAGGDIYHAGTWVIEAEFSMPTIDIGYGFYRLLKTIISLGGISRFLLASFL